MLFELAVQRLTAEERATLLRCFAVTIPHCARGFLWILGSSPDGNLASLTGRRNYTSSLRFLILLLLTESFRGGERVVPYGSLLQFP